MCTAYYFLSYNAYLRNYVRNTSQTTKIVYTQFNQKIEIINSLQKRILQSSSINKYIFSEGTPSIYDERLFHNNMYNIIGYDLPFYHINIVNTETSEIITFGQEFNKKTYLITEEIKNTLIIPVQHLNGAKYVAPLNSTNFYIPNTEITTISMFRSFGKYPLSPAKAIIEIQINIEDIKTLIKETLLSYNIDSGKVIIFNHENELMFPSNLPTSLKEHYQAILLKDKLITTNPVSKHQEISTFYGDPSQGGYTVLLITPTTYIDTSKTFYLTISIFLGGIMFVILFALSYYIAKGISHPIEEITNNIAALDWQQLTRNIDKIDNTSLSELELLSTTYYNMQNRLKKTMQAVMQFQALSIHSQMTALQSQIDSHFLYNTLTIISIVAEESNDPKGATMCMKLSKMLRYVTEDYETQTTFAAEINHTKSYTEFIHIRFGRKVKFYYDIDSTLENLTIPRLIIQPLVENSVKYSRDPNKTLTVHISLYRNAEFWIVKVTDTGMGFSKQSLEELQEKISIFERDRSSMLLSTHGMGLMNIYMRLKLFYEQQCIFTCENTEQGSCITIGGVIHE